MKKRILALSSIISIGLLSACSVSTTSTTNSNTTIANSETTTLDTTTVNSTTANTTTVNTTTTANSTKANTTTANTTTVNTTTAVNTTTTANTTTANTTTANTTTAATTTTSILLTTTDVLTTTDEDINTTTVDNTDTQASFMTTEDGEFVVSGNTYTITKGGTYVCSGELLEGQIIIDAQTAQESSETIDVVIELNGATISNSNVAPIYGINADNLTIKAVKNTENTINDNRKSSETYDSVDQDAAIYSICDLKLAATGTLYVNSTYNNGIHSKDDLKVQKMNLTVNTVNDALKGNDSVTIESGEITLVSSAGEGIKTTNSGLKSSGAQKGYVTVNGGEINIYSAQDGIDAAYDVLVNDCTSLNIYTDSYSNYSGETSVDKSSLYFNVSSTYYSDSYKYVFYFYDQDGNYEWVEAKNPQLTSSGNGRNKTQTYTYQVSYPTSYQSLILYRFFSDVSSYQADLAESSSDNAAINSSMNLITLSSINSGVINYSWSTYRTDSLTQTQLEYSCKGIKASNNITINSGNINIKSTDDAIHSNYNELLENESYSEGNTYINGGNITVTSDDDGIHADYILYINGGTINVLTSYEGIEGSQIVIGDSSLDITPSVYVYAKDDGVNASGNNTSSALITVNSGILDVSVPSGDTDGIDSNGNYVQNGGFVISRCATSDSSGNMAALDIDGSATITSGTFVNAGAISALPTSQSVSYIKFGGSSGSFGFGMPGSSTSSSSYQFGAGEWQLLDSSSNALVTFTLDQTYTNLWIASSSIQTGNSYTLKSSTKIYTWTQSSQAQTYQ